MNEAKCTSVQEVKGLIS